MRIMAVDYGDVRTGIAVSDELGILAGEAWIIEARSPERAARIIAEEAKRRGVDRVILGYPRNMDGSIGPRAEKSSLLAGLIGDKSGLEVVLWDERRTTVDAHRILTDAGRHGKARKKAVDAVAASLILEAYLNSLN